MKIDTEIRHVTKADADLFLELGFPPEEARRLHLASQQKINEIKLLRAVSYTHLRAHET